MRNADYGAQERDETDGACQNECSRADSRIVLAHWPADSVSRGISLGPRSAHSNGSLMSCRRRIIAVLNLVWLKKRCRRLVNEWQ